MSAKNRGSTTITQEFYPTPAASIDKILTEVNWDEVSTFCEPCKGGGAIYDKVPINDANKFYFELSEGTDYLDPKNTKQVDIILTNPPFFFS